MASHRRLFSLFFSTLLIISLLVVREPNLRPEVPPLNDSLSLPRTPADPKTRKKRQQKKEGKRAERKPLKRKLLRRKRLQKRNPQPKKKNPQLRKRPPRSSRTNLKLREKPKAVERRMTWI